MPEEGTTHQNWNEINTKIAEEKSASLWGTNGTNYLGEAFTQDGTNLYSEIRMLYEDTVPDQLYNCTRIFGAPPQFTNIADRHFINADDTESSAALRAGRLFLETFGKTPTIVSISPCKAKHLSIIQRNANWLGSDAMRNSGSLNDSTFRQLLADSLATNSSTLFYTLEQDYVNYYKYVNALNRISANFMGIGEETFPGTSIPYKGFNWMYYRQADAIYSDVTRTDAYNDGVSKWLLKSIGQSIRDSVEYAKTLAEGSWNPFNESGMADIFGTSFQYVHFYATTNTRYSEDIQTTTRQSLIESNLFSSLDAIAKEIQYIGTGTISEGFRADVDRILDEAGDGLLTDLIRSGKNYLSGARIIFPQILDEVTFGKSLTVGVKFVAPSGTPESIYLHCICPLNHILAAALPQQESENMYRFPFFVKCFSKGWFNFDMAVISNVQIQKGGDDTQWNAYRMPTEIDVTFDVTPLYSKLMITNTSNPSKLIGNYSMMEYLGGLCCVNMLDAQFNLKIDAMFSSLYNFTDTGGNTIADILTKNNIVGRIQSFFRL